MIQELSQRLNQASQTLELLRELKIPAYAEKIYLETSPAWFAWKDEEARFLGCTEETAAMCNSSVEKALGKNELEHDSIFAESFKQFFLSEDQHVLKTGQRYQAFGSFDYADTRRHLCYTKERLWDEHHQKFIVLGLGIEMPEYVINFLGQNLNKNLSHKPHESGFVLHFSNVNFTPLENNIQLSSREEECLFLILRGETSKGMARILNISARTVEFHMDNLKTKLGCVRKNQLLKAAVELGYQSFIPERFLKAGF